MAVELLSASRKPTKSADASGHVPILDGVRGLAILMVLGVHLLTANPATGIGFYDTVSAIRSGLWAGVDLFFALSGFLITGILFDSLHKDAYFRNFYARRVLRIFPLYYGFLLVLICLTHPLHLHWHNMQYALLTYTQNLGIFFHDYTGYTPAAFVNLNHFWSLAVEEQFYLVWPVIVYLVRDLRKLLFVALGLSTVALVLRVAMAFYGAAPNAVYQLTPCRMDTLLLGGALALLIRSRWREVVLRYSAPALAGLMCMLLSIGFYYRGLPYNDRFVATVGYSLTALASCSLIATCLSGNTFAKLGFENRVMRFFGKYSYGIYVFHYSIDSGSTAGLRYWLNETFHSKAIAVVLASIPVLAGSVAIAFVSYHVFEKRFLGLKRYFEPRQKVAPAARSVAGVGPG
jgi:peptidoglycan/LPS O-acetylase OafA/YrhL